MEDAAATPVPVEPVEATSELASPAANWGSVQLLALLVLIAGCWAGRELLVPILLAMFFALIASPLVGRLSRIRIPRWMGAFFVVFGGVAIALTLLSQLVAPASDWFDKAPQELRQVTPKLKGLVRKVEEANKAAASIVSAAGAGQTGAASKNPAVLQDQPRAPNLWTLIRAAPRVLAVVAAIILLSFFFVVFGGDLLRGTIALLPRHWQERLTVDILKTVEGELSGYVLTITAINIVLGALTTLTLLLLGLELGDAMLWGAIGGLLNYAPYVGPVVGVVMLALVGVVAFDEPMKMLMPPAIYLGLQVLETEVVTPIILGRRWSISPLIVLLWLLFCGWIWDIAGVFLAVPMLVCFKIIAERIEALRGWAKVIE